MSKILVVTDMQNDFVTGVLGTDAAVEIVPAVIEKIKEYRKNGDAIIFTMDTHSPNYLKSQEGKNLPVEHCIRGTWGWEIIEAINDLIDLDDDLILEKPAFGSCDLASEIEFILNAVDDNEYEVELCGLCTGICVISNGVLVKSELPEVVCIVDVNATACVTPDTKATAIAAMKLLQFKIIGE